MAAKVILFATPVFFLLIALELAWGWYKGRNTYRLNDAINSISLGVLSQITALFGRGLRLGLYILAYQWTQAWTGDFKAFWSTPWGWVLALIFYDFCYYWLHRMGHECAILWAAHVVHHQSQDYNLSTALRQTSTGFLFGWIFYLPMALAGVPPEVFAVVALIDLLYQFWVHTEHIGKLSWFDRVFCSPSNHRVHHAINDRYLDRNYGGILVLWDRIFGSFQEEDEACVYGTRTALNSWNPIRANLEVYGSLAKQAWHAPNWKDKLLVWFKPPGWQPGARSEPPSNPLSTHHQRSPEFTQSSARLQRFDPQISRARALWATGTFGLALALATIFLATAPKLPAATQFVYFVLLCVLIWGIGKLLEPAPTKTTVNRIPTGEEA